MITGLYTAASSMVAQEARQDAVANNLANAGVAGYRRQGIAFHSFATALNSRLAPEATTVRPLSTVINPVITSDLGECAQHATGNPTDLALRGDGYFVVETPAGEAYTRNGAFTLDTDRRLITSDGHPVLGEHGPITLTSSRWAIDGTGQVVADGQVIDRLRIVSFTDSSAAVRMGNGLWATSQTQPAEGAQVAQGYLEGSNVNPVEEMVALISATRQFEASQKCIQALDATLDRAVNDIARA